MKILFLHNNGEVSGSRLPFKEKGELVLFFSPLGERAAEQGTHGHLVLETGFVLGLLEASCCQQPGLREGAGM